MNQFYRESIITDIKKMMYLASITDKIDHNGLIGRYKEIFLNELLEPYLGPFMKTCTGKVFDSTGKESKQIDIIIYDREIIPPILLKKESGLIPSESVLATIEIKSTLGSKELKVGIENALSVKELGLDTTIAKGDSLHTTPSYIFAFKNGFKGKKKITDRIKDSIKKHGGSLHAPISGVCIAGTSNSYFVNAEYLPEEDPGRYSWKEYNPTIEYEEILHFVSICIDTCYHIKEERRNIGINRYVF